MPPKKDVATKNIEDALNCIRNDDWEKLATLPICNRPFIKQKLRSFQQQDKTILSQIGMEVDSILRSIVEEIKPEGEENRTSVRWREYLVIQLYYFGTDKMSATAAQRYLSVVPATYFAARATAIKSIKTHLDNADVKAIRIHVNTLKDESWEKYGGFYVERYMPDGREYFNTILQEIASDTTWIFSVEGWAGAGKTKIAYEVGIKCYELEIFTSVVAVHMDDFTLVSEILDFIGKELSRRNIKEIGTFEEKCAIIYEEIKLRPTLLILDDVDHISEDQMNWNSLITFLEELPYKSSSTRVLVTSGKRGIFDNDFAPGRRHLSFVHTHRVEEYIIEGMQEDEGLQYMYKEIEKRRQIPPSEENLRKFYRNSIGGIPSMMRTFIGMMYSHGLEPDLIIRTTGILVTDADSSEFSGYEPILYNRLEGIYKRITELDPNSPYLLHVLTLFESPAQPQAIAAALGRPMQQTAAALGLLYNVFLIESLNASYDLLPYTREFLLREQTKLKGQQ